MKIINTVNHKELIDALKKYEAINAFDGIKDDDLKDADVIVGCLTKEQLSKCEKLKLYQHTMAGSDALKADWFPKDCVVCNATGSFGIAIAEWTIGAITYLMRNFEAFSLNKVIKKYDRIPAKHSIYGSTVLLIGMGNIGEEVGTRLKALGATIIGIRRHKDDKPDWCDEIGDLNDLNGLLPKADIVVSSLPQSSDTRQILTKKEFMLMKKEAYFINVGRGSVLNTNDLCEVLTMGQLAGVGLDVYEKEPLDEDSPLWNMKNTLISPHVSGNLDLKVTREILAEIATHNIETLINGGTYRNEVDYLTGYRKYIAK